MRAGMPADEEVEVEAIHWPKWPLDSRVEFGPAERFALVAATSGLALTQTKKRGADEMSRTASHHELETARRRSCAISNQWPLWHTAHGSNGENY